MVLLFCIIKDYRRVEDILLAFLENDITGATVIEGHGMGQILGDLPIFAAVRGMFPGTAHDSQVIFTVLEAQKAHLAVTIIEETVGDLSQPGNGICFTLPVGSCRGVSTPLN